MKLIKDKLTVITSAFLLLLSPLAFSQEEAPAVEGWNEGVFYRYGLIVTGR